MFVTPNWTEVFILNCWHLKPDGNFVWPILFVFFPALPSHSLRRESGHDVRRSGCPSDEGGGCAEVPGSRNPPGRHQLGLPDGSVCVQEKKRRWVVEDGVAIIVPWDSNRLSRIKLFFLGLYTMMILLHVINGYIVRISPPPSITRCVHH